ncbi:MAG: tRNA-dihydrouridine synthase family protein [Lachnospiraceae bacterium]|nr:tRNA-dihydrouridine synthase family protein [Lachnospiraceae bacterium]
MKFYFAPMEGITGYVYRNVHREHFPGMDKYYMPFAVANQTLHFKKKEKKDFAPENNSGICVVPQLMANKADEFLWAVKEIHQLGYKEINLNLGCPAATVVSKKKGSGFLAYPEELDGFLQQIFEGIEGSGIDVSIKTRLGKEDMRDAIRLMEIYNRYPISELIIHPRCQKDFYKKDPDMDVFEEVLAVTVHKVCYNGNIFTAEDLAQFTERFPQIGAVMCGRGLLANPALVRQLQGGEALKPEELKQFQYEVARSYRVHELSEIDVMHRMKELWFYMGKLFPDEERMVRNIRKAKHEKDYAIAVDRLFAEGKMIDCICSKNAIRF